MLENRNSANYCGLKDGKVEVYRGRDEAGNKKIEKFDRLIGTVVDISEREWEYKGEPMKSWNVKIVDGEEVYILSLSYSSGFTRGFFNSLVNADLKNPVLISCYVKNDYNNPSVSQGYDLVRWKYKDMPKAETVKVGSKEVKDDSKAVEWMLKIVEEIRAQLPAPKEFEVVAPIDGEKKEDFKSGVVLEDVAPPDYKEVGKTSSGHGTINKPAKASNANMDDDGGGPFPWETEEAKKPATT